MKTWTLIIQIQKERNLLRKKELLEMIIKKEASKKQNLWIKLIERMRGVEIFICQIVIHILSIILIFTRILQEKIMENNFTFLTVK